MKHPAVEGVCHSHRAGNSPWMTDPDTLISASEVPLEIIEMNLKKSFANTGKVLSPSFSFFSSLIKSYLNGCVFLHHLAAKKFRAKFKGRL